MHAVVLELNPFWKQASYRTRNDSSLGNDHRSIASTRYKQCSTLFIEKADEWRRLVLSRPVPLAGFYVAASLSGFAECRREWIVPSKADSARALLLDREFGSYINWATDIPLRASRTE
jgi:hypothetical protein